MAYTRIAALKTTDQFRDYLTGLGVDFQVDDEPLSAADGSPLAQPLDVGGFQVGNRWAVHPMEGWDGTPDGKPTDLTRRRWQHFGESGCKLIWGGEAVAVRHDGRANPNQLYYTPENEAGLAELLEVLKAAHRDEYGANACDDLLVGLQLTHSGRYARPNVKTRLESKIVYHHPLLDERINLNSNDDSCVLTDGEIAGLIEQFVVAAKAAQNIGYQFVDIKHCHGYLGHEFLSAYDRSGSYGGSLENRSRFMREICAAIRQECPGLLLGSRLSFFDMVAFEPENYDEKTGRPGPGRPTVYDGPAYAAFGCRRDEPTQIDLSEPIELLTMMRDEMGMSLVNLTAGSPYSTPHLQRPAYFPPSDGYQSPEDPLLGCFRQLDAVAAVKRAVPGLPLVGSGYTYFQEYLPHVAQAAVQREEVDFVGIGRLVLSQWKLPAQVLQGENYRADKKICRTFSDCTTGPRKGLISGCYPLDPHYKQMPEFAELKKLKKG